MRALLLLFSLVSMAPPAEGLTVYHFGSRLPKAPEEGEPGVVIRRIPWAQLGARGESVNVRRGTSLEPLMYDGRSPMPVESSSTWRYLFDNDLAAYISVPRYECTRQCVGRFGLQGTINIDLPDAVFVEAVRILSGSSSFSQGVVGVVEDVAVSLSPQAFASTTPHTPFTVERYGNTERDLVLTDFAQERRSRAVQIAIPEHDQPLSIAEIQVFGSGVSPHGTYVSDFLDAGRPVVWGGLRWTVEPAEQSRVLLSMRGGDDNDAFRYWRYTGIGGQKTEVTRSQYHALKSTLRADSTYNFDVWSLWSAGVDLATSVPLPTPPRPRRVLQFRVDFLSEGTAGSRLNFLEVRTSVPKAVDVVGELHPVLVEPARLTAFTYTLKPRIQPTDTGFDRVEIRSVVAHFEAVDGVSVDGFEVPFTVESFAEDRVVVGLPRVVQEQTDALVEIRFRARVLRYGAAFAAFLVDSEQALEAPQPVRVGDALDEVIGDRVWIETSVTVKSVLEVVAEPATFSPNGDGVNDETAIIYDLFETTGLVAARLEILDLSGRLVRALHEGRADLGRYALTWDGRDDDGRLVAPGIYLFRVDLGVGDGEFNQLSAVRVVF